ncbi:MAG: UDP-N-acetylmuramoyl-L-alanine--D-glutamate ligase [Bacilli bacterium]|nr:UDP-N-acetylmuramoyl-L-alanine--D-glutamate ligase [Bacilli bacterium]
MNKKLEQFNNNLIGKKIAIIGLGVSNIPLLDYFKEINCEVSLFNEKDIDIDLSNYNYKLYVGENCLDNLVGFDIIFRSPSCLPNRKEIVAEKERGCYVTTEIEEVIKLTPSKVIGVTGSDGKTTTTTLIDLVLRTNGYKTFLGGNIGTPLFTKIKDMTEDDILVLELSSFQLMNMEVSPSRSLITNISPNHLDIHGSYREYIDAKCNIYKNSDGILVVNADNEITSKLESNREVRYFSRYNKTNCFYVLDGKIYFKEKLVYDTSNLKIRGIHNHENICACMSLIYDMVDIDKSFAAISNFSGVEHRLEFVREINGVKWYNDSVSSSPTRTIAGLSSFDEEIVLIAGGYDKNLDYTPIARPILDKVKVLILFGDTKDKIYQAVIDSKKDENIDIYLCNSLSEVANKAYEVAKEKQVVLFSPASASFDMFKNFADRGMQFKDIVNKL